MVAYLGKIAFLIVILNFTWSLQCLTIRCSTYYEPLSKRLIQHVNRMNTTWKAGVNFGDNDDTVISRLAGKRPSQKLNNIPTLPYYTHNDPTVPDNFDARVHWPNCVTIGRVQDQGACKAGWAMSATEAMTDRYCTLSKTKDTYVNVSTEDVISCCGVACGIGCDGGFPTAVWHYWVDNGIVTGGMYNTSDGCKPYSMKSCTHKLPDHTRTGFEPTTALPNCAEEAQTPVCSNICAKNYSISYQDDLHFGKSAYAILPNISQIQAEIFNHGPVQADMQIFGDFFSYKTGVYQHVTGSLIGQHSVKLIGWGKENKTDYWLAVNSWNTNWGEKGLVKILRGKNECGIENNIIAGTPKF
ncbi:cathepsin B-like [Amphiura filiformis]|uniref:cathepsin B-like n=1 Tax=Amphiura filiformis TaxID=82378 RepID=UPI003B21FF41